MPPTYLTSMEVGEYASPDGGARRSPRRGRSRCSRPSVEPLGDGLDAVDAGPAAAAGGGAAPRMNAWAGGTFGSRGRCLLAPNPGIMTLDGTNTWILREPGASRVGRGRPGADRGRAPRPADRGVRRRRAGAAHPPPLRPLRGRRRVRGPEGLRGPRARPGVLPRRATRSRDGEDARRSTGCRCGWSPRPATPPTRSRWCCPATARC